MRSLGRVGLAEVGLTGTRRKHLFPLPSGILCKLYAYNALEQLKQSQLQLVQFEKMSTLENLVAGVGHEINNPIGFLNGSIENAKDYFSGLLAHLELHQ